MFDAGSVIAKVKADIGDFSAKMVEVRNKANTTAGKIKGSVESINKKIESATKSYAKYGAAFAGVAAAGVGIAKSFTSAYGVQESAEAKMISIMKQRTGASDDVIQSMKDQASATQELGVVGDEVLISGQANLATYALTSESINKLTPVMADLAVKSGGVSASFGDAEAAGDKLGKVLDGDVGALKDAGVSFSEAQAEILKTGNETERVNTLMTILSENGITGLNESMAATAEGGMQRMQNSVGDTAEIIGSSMAPMIEFLSGKIKGLAEWFNNLSPGVQSVIGYVVIGVTAFAALGAALLPIMAILPGIIALFGGIATALTAIWTAAMGPIGIIIALGVAFVALGVIIYKNWDTIMEYFDKGWAKIKEIIDNIIQWFVKWGEDMDAKVQMMKNKLLDKIELLKQGFIDKFNALIEAALSLWNGFWDGIAGIWQGIVDTFSTYKGILTGVWYALWDAVKTYFFGVVSGLITMMGNLWLGIKEKFYTGIENIKTLANSFWSGLKGIFSGGGTAISEMWTNTMEGIKSKAMGIWETIKSGVKAKINDFLGIINGMLGRINGILGSVGIPSIPEIPMLAEGGIVTKPTLAMIGEGGESEAVIPLSKLNSMTGGGDGGPQFVFNGPVWSSDVAQEVMEDAFTAMRSNLAF